MIKIICHTNLDLLNEVWPTELPAIPTIGTKIQSRTVHNGKFQLELEVCQVTYKYYESENDFPDNGKWIPHIELHMTSWHKLLRAEKKGACQGSITAFYEWYARALGVSVSRFI